MALTSSGTGQTVLYFSLSILVISANLLVVVAVRYMKSAKKATIVFLCQLAVCNLVQGIIFLLKAFFFIWPVQEEDECLAFIALSVGTSGAYVTGILYLYLDLFLALKKLSILKPFISTRTAFWMVVFAWIVWMLIGAAGYLFINPDWDYDKSDGCYLSSGGYGSEYVIALCVLFLVMFIVIMVCHIGTLHVMRNTYRNVNSNAKANAKLRDDPRTSMSDCSLGSPDAEDGSPIRSKTGIPAERSRTSEVASAAASIPCQQRAQSKWLKKNMSVMRIVVIIMCIFSVCWYPSVVIIIVVAVCDDCLPAAVIYLSNVLIIVQYISNGFIYLAKSREFQEAFKRLFSCCSKKIKPSDDRAGDSVNTAVL